MDVWWREVIEVIRGHKRDRNKTSKTVIVYVLILIVNFFASAVKANRPPRFVVDGNVGSEMVVRMREGTGGARGRRVIR